MLIPMTPESVQNIPVVEKSLKNISKESLIEEENEVQLPY